MVLNLPFIESVNTKYVKLIKTTKGVTLGPGTYTLSIFRYLRILDLQDNIGKGYLVLDLPFI